MSYELPTSSAVCFIAQLVRVFLLYTDSCVKPLPTLHNRFISSSGGVRLGKWSSVAPPTSTTLNQVLGVKPLPTLHNRFISSSGGVRLGKWSSVAPPTSTTLNQVLGSLRGLRFVTLNLTLMVFLRVLRFSSLCKFYFDAKIWAIERLNIYLWLGRMCNHFLRNWR